MNRKIDIPEFCATFCRRSSLNTEVLDILQSNLILLSPHEKSFEFANLLQEILDGCEVYNPDPEFLRKPYEIDETEFRNLVEKTYFRIQKFLEK